MFAQILISFFILLMFILPGNVFAKSDTSVSVSTSLAPTYSQLPPTISSTSPIYTDLMVYNIFHSMSCLAVGQSLIGQSCLTYQLSKNAQGIISGVPVLAQTNLQGGALGAVSGIIGALYQNPPVRTADYLASVGQDWGIVKPANAQVFGAGEKVLNPIVKIWQVSRNISYLMMIVIFVIIGLMIMFRNKINPQTVISAQAALPGLIIGLIMITFSYFFAGLISDFAFIGTNVVGYYFSAVREEVPPQNLVRDLENTNILSLFGKFVGVIDQGKADSVASAIFDNVGPTAANYVRILVGFFAAQFIAPIAGSTQALPPPWGLIAAPAISTIFGLVGGIAPTFLLSFMLAFIATLALIYQMVKLLLRLINAYLTIIFLTISAPFQFLFASLPGRQGVATGWILNMLANILVFPAVLAVLYFVAFLLAPTNRGEYAPLKTSNPNQIQASIISPAYAADQIKVVDSSTFPLLGGMNLDFIQLLLAFGTLMALPAIPDIVVKSIGKMGQAGQLIGQEIGGGIGQGRQFTNQGQSAIFGRTQGLLNETTGEKGLVWNPSSGEFERRVTKPGMAQLQRKVYTTGPKKGQQHWTIKS